MKKLLSSMIALMLVSFSYQASAATPYQTGIDSDSLSKPVLFASHEEEMKKKKKKESDEPDCE